MFETTIAGSLPKPSWLAEPNKLWPQWKLAGDARARLAATGIVVASPSQPTIASVRPGSEAARLKLRPGDKVESVSVPNERPSPFWFAIPALLVLAGLAALQRRRRAVAVALAA